MAVSLPRFFTLRNPVTVNLYLGVPENPPAGLPGFVKFVESQIFSPRAKFAAELSQTGDGTLVNIRSCYNNKYWVAHRINNDYYIVASASKPQEDQSKPECTLFQPQQRNNQEILLFSVSLSLYSQLSLANEWHYGITLGLQPLGRGFSVVDFETLTILPPQVSFRSEALDGDYLCSRFVSGGTYLLFEPGLDIGDPLVAQDLSVVNTDGSYHIASAFSGRYWRRNWQNSFIRADERAFYDGDSFTFVKISDNIFALRQVHTNRFCAADNFGDVVNCLSAKYSTLERQTRLIVEERVLQREIFNIRYRLSDSRIYQEEIKEVTHAFATNNSPVNESSMTLSYSILTSTTTSWSDSKSSNFGVNVNFSVTLVPLIAKMGIDLSAEYNRTFEWGESETVENTRTASYTVVVPPLTQIRVALMSTTAVCDVPFSYTQRDVLHNGQPVSTIKDDGIFTGINSYNFYFESTEKPIN